MKHCNIFNAKGVSESRKVARGPKDPPPGVIGLRIETKGIGLVDIVPLHIL